MCCTRLAENTGRKKSLKNSPYAHHRTSLSGCIFATKACIDNRKKLLNSNISPTCSHNMVNFGTLAAEIQVWGSPANLNGSRVLASLLHQRRSTDVNQTLQDVWRLLGWYTIHFRGLLPPNGILQGANCVQILRSPILAALLHGTRVVGVNQTFGVEQKTPLIFGRAAITLPTF